MTPFEAISLLFSLGAFVVSIFAFKQSKRAAQANEESAWYAWRANDLTYMGQVQAIVEKTKSEIDQARLQGDEKKAQSLEFASARLQLDHLRDFANRNEDTRRYFAEYFRGIALIQTEDKEAIENLIEYVLKEGTAK